jgi:hypothetical protein
MIPALAAAGGATCTGHDALFCCWAFRRGARRRALTKRVHRGGGQTEAGAGGGKGIAAPMSGVPGGGLRGVLGPGPWLSMIAALGRVGRHEVPTAHATVHHRAPWPTSISSHRHADD